ncbi:MAG TPA: hypothetical protein VGE52_16285 [Pirellulales bacterium]
MTASIRRYIGAALGLWFGLLALLALINAVVDPYCAYGRGASVFADYKPANDRPEIKAERVALLQPTTLILGSSRALVFDPEWPEWGPRPAFNLGVAGASMQQVASAFRYCTKTTRVERLLLCVDYSQFCDNPGDDPFERSRLSPDFSPVSYHFQNLLSLNALDATRQTLRNYLASRVTSYTPLGYVRHGRFPLKAAPRLRFVATLKDSGRLIARRRSDDYTNALREIAQACDERDVELNVVVSPVHCLLLESLVAQGLWNDYRDWLGDVTETVETETEGEARVWDFAGYNRYTTEPVPLTNAAPEPLYYQEASHFTGALARKVFERVYALPEADESFGSLVQPSDVQTRLIVLDAERTKWLATRPASLALLHEALPTRIAAEASADSVRLAR